jgi:hypothetical protein
VTWFLTTRLGRILSAAVLGVIAVLTFGFVKKKQGRAEARAEAQEDDYENAADIRDRVSRNLDDRLREYEDRGFRD